MPKQKEKKVEKKAEKKVEKKQKKEKKPEKKVEKKEQELQPSKDFLKMIKIIKGIPTFFVPGDQSPLSLLILHEHLGLVENFIQTIQEILRKRKITLAIPDYFSGVAEIDSEAEFDPLQNISFKKIHQIFSEMTEFLKNRQKKVILVGFSVGAAFGLKLLELIPNIDAGIFYYGCPDLSKADFSTIKCPTKVVYGAADKIKHLSDKATIEKLMEMTAGQSNFDFQGVEYASHGFMNPESAHFNEKIFEKGKTIFLKFIDEIEAKLPPTAKKSLKGNKEDDKDKDRQKSKDKKKDKEESGGCQIY